MTTIAFDGKILAADRRSTENGFIADICKIHKLLTGGYFAFAGNIEAGLAIFEWLNRNSVEEVRPTIESGLAATGLIVYREYCVAKIAVRLVSNMCRSWPVTEQYTAIGSGRNFAIGAMAKGANAIEAVSIANQFDCYTGKEVDWFEL